MRTMIATWLALSLGLSTLSTAGCGDDDRAGLNQQDGTTGPDLDGAEPDGAEPVDGVGPDLAGQDAPGSDTATPDAGPDSATPDSNVPLPDAVDDTVTVPDVADDSVAPPDDVPPDTDPDVAPDVVDDVAVPPTDTTEDGGPDTATDTTPGDDVTLPPDDGCPIYQRRCGGVCIQTNIDPQNCGGCDVVCETGEVCSAGACTSSCLSGLEICEGSCVDFQTDRNHCGACGNACDVDEGCVSGSCAPGVIVDPPPGGCADIPPFVETIGDDEVCLGNLAQRQFTWAICACNAVSTTNVVRTDAYDSRLGPWEPGGTGGGIGMNGDFRATNVLDIGGTLWVAGTGGIDTRNVVDIAHEVHSGGPFAPRGITAVGRDAFVNGDVSAANTLSIVGRLFQPENASVSGSVTYAERVTGPVEVADACRCEPDDLLPIGEIVARHVTDNDNAAVGLDPDVLVDPDGDINLTLPCGRYYLSQISTSQKLSIVATGRTALFIGGDITSSNELQISIVPGAELDVFVGGTFNTNNRVRIGSANFSALVRLYVGGQSTLTWNNNVLIGAYVYAGRTPLSLSNKFEVFGGLFVSNLEASNEVTVHYDRAILSAGEECEEPPPEEATCETCVDCANQACVDGFCGACTTSADCCSPLVCVEGQCLSLGISIE